MTTPLRLWRTMNDRLASSIIAGVSTMECAWLFALLALVSLPGALLSGDAVVIVGWVAQTFLQLVLLSVIMAGQRQSDRERREDHLALCEMVAETREEIGLIREIHDAVVPPVVDLQMIIRREDGDGGPPLS